MTAEALFVVIGKEESCDGREAIGDCSEVAATVDGYVELGCSQNVSIPLNPCYKSLTKIFKPPTVFIA